MRKETKIGYLLKTLTLVYGLLAITVSSFSNIIQERIEEDLSRIEFNSNEENSERNQETIYLPDYLASTSTFQVLVDHVQNILFVISFVKEIKGWYEVILEYQGISFFKVLFQNIIAPNAP